MNRSAKERENSIERLKSMLKPGETVYTKIVHVSRSGMYRTLDAYVIRDNSPVKITFLTCTAIDYRYDVKHDALGISGCGMDMGFEVVYNIGRVLFPDGFDCIGDNCPSNDHSNHENPAHHKDGGYALIQKWM